MLSTLSAVPSCIWHGVIPISLTMTQCYDKSYAKLMSVLASRSNYSLKTLFLSVWIWMTPRPPLSVRNARNNNTRTVFVPRPFFAGEGKNGTVRACVGYSVKSR